MVVHPTLVKDPTKSENSAAEDPTEAEDSNLTQRMLGLVKGIRDASGPGLVAATITCVPASRDSSTERQPHHTTPLVRVHEGAPFQGRGWDYRVTVHRIKEHFVYLSEISRGQNASISPQTASEARQIWYDLWAASGFALPVPAACTGPDARLMYAWDRDEHHFEIELIPGEPTELFYRNRQTGELWGEEYTVGHPLPQGTAAKLRLFI